MSAEKHIQANSPYLKELIRLRDDGYSWSAIGRYFNKDHTTIRHHYVRWVGKPSKTKTRREAHQTISILPSWDGHKHLCCNSIVHTKHIVTCINIQGLWTLPFEYQNRFQNIKAVRVNKYDHLFDEDIRLGKSYQQYRLTK